jgi:DNA-binding XRE family transcriptional regulator
MIKLKVRQVCKEKGMSMSRLTRDAEIDYNTVKRLFDEPGYNPSIDTLAKVARALHVKVDDLFEEIPDR